MNLAPHIEQDIEYQFAAKFVAICEKISGFHRPYDHLSCNPAITMAYVSQHLDKPWCWQALTYNPAISIAYMEQHPEYPWHQDEYSLRKYGGEAEGIILDEFLVDYTSEIRPDQWDCKNISLAMIEENMKAIDSLGFDEEQERNLNHVAWQNLSNNPNLTLDFLEKFYKKPWTEMLLFNPLHVAKAQFRKEYIAAYTIQQAYARAKYIPLYAYCRKLHQQFYDEQFGMVV